MNEIYLDILGYAKSWWPDDDPLKDITGWDELWMYLSELRKVIPRRYTAVHDPFGWYLRTEKLGPSGWVLEDVGKYYPGRDECLNSIMIGPYGYINYTS